MAHTCPDCGTTCYCHGDIDDIILDEDEAVNRCDHCDDDEPEEDWYWDADTALVP